jgi:Methyltransferase domain
VRDITDVEALLAEQVAFYREWAATYDDAVHHDANERDRPELRQALAAFEPVGEVLEVAGGTGNWTVELSPFARGLTVVDSAPEALSINRAKLSSTPVPVEYVCNDIFAWEPPRPYDVVFFSFWLSHVPTTRFELFWQLVDQSLTPDGRVFFIDSATPRHMSGRRAGANELVSRLDDPESGLSWRTLSNGNQYHIFKIFWQPNVLQRRLGTCGFDMSVQETAHGQCIYGHGRRRP